jgi:hypothetical protein
MGWNWDLVLLYPEATGPSEEAESTARGRAEAAIRGHRGVEDYALGTFFPTFPQGRPLEVGPDRVAVPGLVAFDGAARVGPSIITGRKPAAPDEILFGPETLDELRLHIGDRVDVIGQAGTWEEPGEETTATVRVVGVGVVPMSERVGRGAAMTLDGLARLSPGVRAQAVYVRLTSGADPEGVIDAFRTAFPRATRDEVTIGGFAGFPPRS